MLLQETFISTSHICVASLSASAVVQIVNKMALFDFIAEGDHKQT